MVAQSSTHWWYRVRRELVQKFLNQYVGQGGAVLEVGCGAGDTLLMLKKTYSVSGIDMSDEAVRITKEKGVPVQKGDATNIPAAHELFDAVLALDVLEHIEKPDNALKEMKRVLKPGGTLVVFVPAFMFLWSVTDVLSHHYRRYTRHELVALIESAGFTVVRSSYFNTLLFPLIALTRLTVRTLHIAVGSEMGTGTGLMNEFLYYIFRIEVPLLTHVNFPFGVSIAVIAKKL